MRYRFQTREIGEFDIHFRTLRDRQQFEDVNNVAESMGVSPASWPMFGVVWQAGEVLAQLMAVYDIDSRRILEVGCGVGLASLVLNRRHANISATDFHPSAQQHLDYNTDLNGDPRIPFLRSDWRDTQDPGFGLFDVIIGSDVIFEPDHTEILVNFIEQHAKPRCEFVLVEAGRGYMPEFSRRMAALEFQHEQLEHIAPFTNGDSYRGKIHRFRRGFS